MGYSINQDMQEVYDNPDKWTNHGRDILRSSCKHKEGVEETEWCAKCDISEDAGTPIMNYIYPLELNGFEDEKILDLCLSTKKGSYSITEEEKTLFFCQHTFVHGSVKT